MFKFLKKLLDSKPKISDNTQTVTKGKVMSTNYTAEMVSEMEAQGTFTYAEAGEFAEKYGLKLRSVIAKVLSLKLVYVPKPVKVTKAGEPVVRKGEFVSAIEAIAGVAVPSLVKASKADLETLANALVRASVAGEAN